MDQTARLWQVATGRSVGVLHGHLGGLTHVCISSDGSLVITASLDETLRIWNARTGAPIATLMGHRGRIASLQTDPSGTYLISSEAPSAAIRLWNLDVLDRAILEGHGSYVYDTAVGRDGGRIASAAWDNTVRLWDSASGKQVAVLNGSKQPNVGVAWHSKRDQVATISADKTIWLWDANTGKAQRTLKVSSMPQFGFGARLDFHPTNPLLAVGNGREVRIWNTDNYDVFADLSRHPITVSVVRYNSAGKRLASADIRGNIRIWNTETNELIGEIKANRSSITGLAFSPDGERLASTSIDKTVRIWNVTNLKQIAVLDHKHIVYDVAFHPDPNEKRLAVASRDNTIWLWDTARWELVVQVLGHRDYVHSVTFTPDGSRLVSGSGDFTVRVWSTK